MADADDIAPPDCESCGETTAVVRVRRVYLPIDLEAQAEERSRPLEDAGLDAGDDVDVRLGDLEWWCEVCRIHYPHQVD
jgi:hypothetical protein